ncbi:hypothetical protein KF840_20675 [bacterium]|nr:hypothetical protein [bacterium]
MAPVDRPPPLDRADAADADGDLERRVRIGIALCVLPILLFALFDLLLLPAAELPVYWGIKLAALAVLGLSVALLRQRRPSSRRRLVAVGLGCVTAMYLLSTTSAILARDAETTGIMSMAVSLATATLLPWGAWPQRLVVGLGILSTALAHHFGAGGLHGLLGYPTVGLLIGMGLSVHVAAELERSRTALAQRRDAQRRAAAEVRQLNERLEARVRERTAQLERLNGELQAEIEERGRYAAELRQSQAAASALIENAEDAIWAIDRAGRLLIRNAAVRHRYAVATGSELTNPDDYPAAVRQHLAAYWAPLYARGLVGERFTDEQVIDGPHGRRIFVNAFNPIVIDGEVAGLAVFSSEVTEQRRSEEAARQRQAELTHVQRLSTLGEMAAGLAHEINQPLAAIVNYARGCARRLRGDPGSVPEVMPALDSIATEALRAGEVIRRLRQLVRKEAPRQETIDLNALVEEAARIIEPEARQAGVEIEELFAVALPAVVGDPIQVEQVVLNLLRNAVEAMSGGPPRRILQLTTRPTGSGMAEVAVRDTGPGVAAGVAEAMFEPFVSTKPNGIGVGLSISRTIIESHHGRLWASANAEGGMTFRFALPAAGETAARAISDGVAAAPARRDIGASAPRGG